MDVDDDQSVLRWTIADFAEQMRRSRAVDDHTSGLFVLKAGGREVHFFLQLYRKYSEDSVASPCIAICRVDYNEEWPLSLENLPLWSEWEDGARSEEEKITHSEDGEILCDFLSQEELDELEAGESLAVCLRFPPPAVVRPVPLEPLLAEFSALAHDLPHADFRWRGELELEELGCFQLELAKEDGRLPGDENADPTVEDRVFVANLFLPQLPPNVAEVVLKYEMWIVDRDSENKPEEQQARTRVKGNIASFLPDGEPAGVLFELSEFAGWTVGRVHVRMHGFRVVPKPPLVQTS